MQTPASTYQCSCHEIRLFLLLEFVFARSMSPLIGFSSGGRDLSPKHPFLAGLERKQRETPQVELLLDRYWLTVQHQRRF
jgi:hypothetical protein